MYDMLGGGEKDGSVNIFLITHKIMNLFTFLLKQIEMNKISCVNYNFKLTVI